MMRLLAGLLLACISAFGAQAQTMPSPVVDHVIQVGLPSNAALKAASVNGLVAGSTVRRLGFTTAGDGGGADYVYGTAACSLNAGAGDNGSQVAPTAGVGCWTAVLPRLPSPKIWGAKEDGSTDDSAALSAALASVPDGVTIDRAATLYTASGILVPDNKVLAGASFGGVSAPGSTILCGLSVAVCVTGGSSDNQPVTIRNLLISRAPGTIPAGSTCLSLPGDYTPTVDTVECYRHAIGFAFSTVNGTEGIYYHLNNVMTCAISDAHMQISGVPGVYVSGSTLGCNGGFDVPSNAFVRVQGNWDASMGTVHLTDTQFNQGQNSTVCGFAFQNFTGSTNVLNDFEVIGGHLETAQNFMCSDATVKGLSLVQILGLWAGGGWGGTNHYFALNAATSLNSFALIGNSLTGWSDVTMAPAAQINDLKMAADSFLMPVHITGVSNSTMNLTGDTFNGVTVDGTWASAVITGTNQGGAYSFTPSGRIAVNIPGVSMGDCKGAIGLAFGGASTGIAYVSGAPVCQWQYEGDKVFVSYYIALTSKGTATGAATVTGLPYTAGTSLGPAWSPLYNENMAALSGPLIEGNGTATNYVSLYQQGATGLTVATDANFTNTSIIQGTIEYGAKTP